MKWISVKKELPKSGGDLLVWCRETGTHQAGSRHAVRSKGKWEFVDSEGNREDGPRSSLITHWMRINPPRVLP